jgi:integrase
VASHVNLLGYLRISEALDLKLDDVDIEQGVLTIRAAKFGRSALVQATVSRRPLGNVTLTPLAVVANVTGITEARV